MLFSSLLAFTHFLSEQRLNPDSFGKRSNVRNFTLRELLLKANSIIVRV